MLNDLLDKLQARRQPPVNLETIRAKMQANRAADPFGGLRRALARHDGTGNHPRPVPMMVRNVKVLVETPKGSYRRGIGKDGKPWKSLSHGNYGRIAHATGIDLEGLDALVGDDPESKNVYIVNQNDPDTGMLDEQKVVLQSPNIESARRLYLSNLPSEKYLRSITEMPFDTFAGMVNRAGPGGIRWTKKLRRERKDADRAIFSAYDPSEPRDPKGKWAKSAGASEYEKKQADIVAGAKARLAGKADSGFGDRAMKAAKSVGKEGRAPLGDKVLISHAHKAYNASNPPMPLEDFKRNLIQHAASHLVREDMPWVHPDIGASEAKAGPSSYHYIRTGGSVSSHNESSRSE